MHLHRGVLLALALCAFNPAAAQTQSQNAQNGYSSTYGNSESISSAAGGTTSSTPSRGNAGTMFSGWHSGSQQQTASMTSSILQQTTQTVSPNGPAQSSIVGDPSPQSTLSVKSTTLSSVSSQLSSVTGTSTASGISTQSNGRYVQENSSQVSSTTPSSRYSGTYQNSRGQPSSTDTSSKMSTRSLSSSVGSESSSLNPTTNYQTRVSESQQSSGSYSRAFNTTSSNGLATLATSRGPTSHIRLTSAPTSSGSMSASRKPDRDSSSSSLSPVVPGSSVSSSETLSSVQPSYAMQSSIHGSEQNNATLYSSQATTSAIASNEGPSNTVQQIATMTALNSEIKSSKTSVTLLTTTTLSSEQSGMSASATTSSSEMTSLNSVSQDTSRESSSSNIAATASFSQTSTNSSNGISSSQPTEMISPLAPMSSITEGASSSLAQSSPVSVTTFSTASMMDQAPGSWPSASLSSDHLMMASTNTASSSSVTVQKPLSGTSDITQSVITSATQSFPQGSTGAMATSPVGEYNTIASNVGSGPLPTHGSSLKTSSARTRATTEEPSQTSSTATAIATQSSPSYSSSMESFQSPAPSLEYETAKSSASRTSGSIESLLSTSDMGSRQTLNPTVITTPATRMPEPSGSESSSEYSAKYSSTSKSALPFSSGVSETSTNDSPSPQSDNLVTGVETSQPSEPSTSPRISMAESMEKYSKTEAGLNVPLPSSAEAQTSQETQAPMPSLISPTHIASGTSTTFGDSHPSMSSSMPASIESYSLTSESQVYAPSPTLATNGSEISSSVGAATSSQNFMMPTMPSSGILSISESQTATLSLSSEVSPLTFAPGAAESPMGPTSTLTGSQLPGGAISSPSSQSSNIFGSSSGSSESQESNSAFQASQSSETSNTVDAGTRTVPTRLSNNNHPGLQTISQTMPLASQSMGSSQNPNEQLSRIMPISSQPSNATRGPISTQNPSYNISQSVSPTPSQSSPAKSSFQSSQLQSDLFTTADSLSPSPTQQMPRQSISAKMSNAVATANTIDRVTSSEQSTLLPSEVSSAGVVISQLPKSSPSTNPVVYATEPFNSASRQSLAAATSNDTSFLDLGTSPPGTTSQRILASASQSITSSSTHRTSVAPVTTGRTSTNNGGNSEPAVNMPPEHGVNGELDNAALKSSNMPHSGPGSQDTNNGRPISGENRDQEQNKSSHRVHSAADQKSSETLSHDNAGDQRFQAVQLQLPQPANPNTGGSWGSPAAQMQPNQPASVNKGGDRSRPATHPNHDGLTFTPIISNPFNFYGGALFDPSSNSMTSGSDRMTQAREINANLPPSIQNALNDNSINYYHPGIGDFYYSKVCGDAGCSIVQVAISCNCYVDGADQQLHYLRVNKVAELKVSTFKNDTRLPPATQYLVKPGDTLLDIAVRYGAELSLVIAANPAILKPDLIFPGEVIRIPAQAYTVVKEDYLYKIAKAHGVSLSVIEALNDQIDNPDLIFPGQIIKVPARKFGSPFCTTVEPGDSLFSISNNLGVTLSSVEAVNPHIKDKNLIFPKQILNVPVYLPAQGNLTSHNFCPVCDMNNKNAPRLTGAKFASAAAAPKLVVTTIQVGPTAAPIIAKAPYQRSSLSNSWVDKASWKLFRLI